jgi:hypothetical protein
MIELIGFIVRYDGGELVRSLLIWDDVTRALARCPLATRRRAPAFALTTG